MRTEGGIKPVAVYQYGMESERGAFFFEEADDALAFLAERLAQEEGDDPDDLAELQVQTDSMTDGEVIVVVLQDACMPTDFELTPTGSGFIHTKWEAPVDCAWAPPRAIVFIVPKDPGTGFVYDADDPPEVVLTVIEEDS